MPRSGFDLIAQRVFFAVLAAGLLVMLAANLPGHLTYDSIIGLTEGRFHQRITWAPAFYSWVLGVFDAVVAGTGLYVVASALLLFGALASFASLRGKVSWLGALVAAAIVFTPQLVIYQAIVWKDVFFANLAVAGMVSLAHAAAVWNSKARRWLWLLAALLLLAAAALTRQNGIIVGAVACVALGWTAARGALRRGLGWGLCGLLVLLATMQVMGTYATPAPPSAKNGSGDGMGKGVRILQNYDLLGMIALEPQVRLDALEKTAPPAAVASLRIIAPRYYSAERVDFLAQDAGFTDAIAKISERKLAAQWSELVMQRPDLYLRHRVEVFRWVFLTPVIDRCLPLSVGVEGDPQATETLGVAMGKDPADIQVYNYATWLLDTPVFSHLAYAAIALAVGGLLLLRRDPADLPMAGLMLAALGFAASFFLVSLACDYRYLYFLDLAALAGLLYFAVDPRLSRRAPR